MVHVMRPKGTPTPHAGGLSAAVALPPCRYLVKGRQAAPSSERGVLISYEWGEAAYSEFGGGVLDSVVTQVR